MMKFGIALLVVLGLALAACGDVPGVFDAGTTSTGGGTDGTDPDVCEPDVASDWGQTCSAFSPECPGGSECRTIQGMGSVNGICSTQCCGQNDADEALHCPDVAPGLETCIILHVDDTWWCAVVCTNASHCPDGQTCQPAPEASVSVCYPPQPE